MAQLPFRMNRTGKQFPGAATGKACENSFSDVWILYFLTTSNDLEAKYD
jgi:hypothetical protein